MFSAEDAVTTSQLTSSSLRSSGWWMPPSRPSSDAGNGNLISSLSTCIVGLQRRRDRPESREQRTENENRSRLASLFGHRWSRLPRGCFRCKQAIGTRQAVGIHIPIHNSPSHGSKSTSDATRGPKLRSTFSAVSPARQFCRLLHVLAIPLSARMLGKFWKKSLARAPSITTLAVDYTVRPPFGWRSGDCHPLHLRQFRVGLYPVSSLLWYCFFRYPCPRFIQRTVFQTRPLSGRDVPCVSNSSKPETVLACRDLYSGSLPLASSVARMAKLFEPPYFICTDVFCFSHSPFITHIIELVSILPNTPFLQVKKALHCFKLTTEIPLPTNSQNAPLNLPLHRPPPHPHNRPPPQHQPRRLLPGPSSR